MAKYVEFQRVTDDSRILVNPESVDIITPNGDDDTDGSVKLWLPGSSNGLAVHGKMDEVHAKLEGRAGGRVTTQPLRA